MVRGTNPGQMDWVLQFYSPSTTRSAIGEDVVSMTAVSGSWRAQKLESEGNEKHEAGQQVGNNTLTFRMRDIRKQFVPDFTWEFDAYQVSNTTLTKRYKVSRISEEGRRNYILITGEARDNGQG